MMQWQSLLAPRRLGEQAPAKATTFRTPFHRDHDKILFSGAFRRLGRKTQVHTLSDNDHVHTRLTHSLEVGCVGRTLGMTVASRLSKQLPDWMTAADMGAIVQAGCLAHDIGNPPFGHAGEYAIGDWFQTNTHKLKKLTDVELQDICAYEGNAQGLRIVSQLEYNQFMGGMRLTAPTMATMIKYPWTVDQAQHNKFNIFQSELDIMNQLAEQLGLKQLSDSSWVRHPLTYLLEAADDICYAIVDLEDGVEMDLIDYRDVEPIMASLSQRDKPVAVGLFSDRRRLAAWRGDVIENAVLEMSQAFVEQIDVILKGELEGTLIDYCPTYIQEGVRSAKELAKTEIFNHARKAKLEVGAFSIIGILLKGYINAVNELLSTGENHFRNEKLLSLIGNNLPSATDSHYKAYRRVLDFIGGMSDNYAVDLAQAIAGQNFK